MFEQYFFGKELKSLDSPNVPNFTEPKRKLWSERVAAAKKNIQFLKLDNSLEAPREKKKIVVLDFHNVFDENLQKSVQQCSKWNELGYEVHVCSFVGKGGYLHAELLATFEDPSLQKVIRSLIVVFDRKHLKKGKGSIIKMFGDNEDVPLFFVDDGVENLVNVYQVNKPLKQNIHLVHYVSVPSTRKYESEPYTKRIDNFDKLISYIS